MAGQFGDYVYETDEGRLYAVKLDRSNSLNSALGRVPYGDQEDPKAPGEYLTRQPTGLRLRTVLVIQADTGNRRELVCCTPTCDAFTGVAKSVYLTDYNDGQEKQYKILRAIPEKQFSPPKPDI
jgi:hypothetical protein